VGWRKLGAQRADPGQSINISVPALSGAFSVPRFRAEIVLALPVADDSFRLQGVFGGGRPRPCSVALAISPLYIALASTPSLLHSQG